MIPLSKGGHNQPFNIQPLCIVCHRTKDNIPATTRKIVTVNFVKVTNAKKRKK